jgi:hypothetical protein
MDERNPYAPTPASLTAGSCSQHARSSGVWRDGSVLVMLPNTSLPHRCVKCNAVADQPTRERKVYWHHPGIYVLVLINLIIYAIVAAIVRKTAIVSPGLCSEHKEKHRNAMIIGWGLALLGIGLFIAAGMGAAPDHTGEVVLAGLLAIFTGIVWGIVVGRIVYAKRIDEQFVRLRGCGPEFLDSLPPFME